MRNALEAGTILIERGTLMADACLPKGGPDPSGWISVGRFDRSELETSIRQAGWTFFYLAGEIKSTVFGFDREETVGKAVGRLVKNVGTRHLNCLEITRVAMSSFLGVPYVTVAGHARHIQESMVLSRAAISRKRDELSAEGSQFKEVLV